MMMMDESLVYVGPKAYQGLFFQILKFMADKIREQ